MRRKLYIFRYVMNIVEKHMHYIIPVELQESYLFVPQCELLLWRCFGGKSSSTVVRSSIVFCVQCESHSMRFLTFQILRLGPSHPFCDWPEVELQEKHSRATVLQAMLLQTLGSLDQNL